MEKVSVKITTKGDEVYINLPKALRENGGEDLRMLFVKRSSPITIVDYFDGKVSEDEVKRFVGNSDYSGVITTNKAVRNLFKGKLKSEYDVMNSNYCPLCINGKFQVPPAYRYYFKDGNFTLLYDNKSQILGEIVDSEVLRNVQIYIDNNLTTTTTDNL